MPTLPLQGWTCTHWGAGGAGHPRQAGAPENPMTYAAAALSLLFGVNSYLLLWEGLPALPAFTPSVPVSCAPTAPTATAKVTDDLLIAKSDRHLGTLIAVAFSVAFDWAELPTALGRCWLLVSATPRPAVLLSSCASAGSASSAPWGVPRALALCSPGVQAPMTSSPPLKAPGTEPIFLSTQPLPNLLLASPLHCPGVRYLASYLVRQVL